MSAAQDWAPEVADLARCFQEESDLREAKALDMACQRKIEAGYALTDDELVDWRRSVAVVAAAFVNQSTPLAAAPGAVAHDPTPPHPDRAGALPSAPAHPTR